jgi:hypothetical protein
VVTQGREHDYRWYCSNLDCPRHANAEDHPDDYWPDWVETEDKSDGKPRSELKLLVRPDVYIELIDADRDECNRTEGGTSTGAGLRSVLLKYLPEDAVNALPNPFVVEINRNLPTQAMPCLYTSED